MFIASKQFIEKYIQLLDFNPKSFFLELWESEMSWEEAAEVVMAIQHAGINVEDARFQALIELAYHQVAKFASGTCGLSAMPLHDFLYGYMYNFIGYTFDQTEKFMIERASLWSPAVNIYMSENNVVIIEKV